MTKQRQTPANGRKRLWIIAAAMAVVVGLAGIAGSVMAAQGAPNSAGKANGVYSAAAGGGGIIASWENVTTGKGAFTFVCDELNVNTDYEYSWYAQRQDLGAYGVYNYRLLIAIDGALYADLTSKYKDFDGGIDGFTNNGTLEWVRKGEDKTLPAKFTITAKSKYAIVELPDDPTKEGHTFTGWYYGSECSDECTAYAGEMIFENTALHAHFTINTYRVIFMVDGGSGVSGQTVDWGTVLSGDTLPTTTRAGYNFLGWYNGETRYDGEAIKSDVTLTAKWEIKTFKVTFYGVDGEVFKEITVDYGTSLQSAAKAANVQNMALYTASGERLSLANSAITDNTAVLTAELSKAEKIGAFLGRHIWLVWTACGVIGFLVLAFGVSLVIIRKRG